MAMVKRFFILITMLVCLKTACAQQQAAIWYFGNHAGLDFSSGEPVALTDGALNTFEGSATIADENGSLLFYTDGVTVWNRLHQPMPNGRNLWGSYTTTQTLIVPKPGNDPIYYIFTASPQFDYIFGPGTDSVGFHYSVVDMSVDGGLGDVTQKNILLFKNTTEKITAVHHANGHDVWVVTHEWGNNNFRSYLVTENGIEPIPVISSIGEIHSGGGANNSNAIAYMKLSPDGNYIVSALWEKIIQIFTFNTNTGQVNSLKESIVNVNNAGLHLYGIEFSSNSKFLYYPVSLQYCGVNDPDNQAEIWQYSFENSKSTKVGSAIGAFNAMQLAPNGKIYITRCNEIIRESNFMAVINNPNRRGKDCNFQEKDVSLITGNNNIGLPNFIQSYFLFPDPVIDMPNIFTPNGDNYNPVFKPMQFENMLEARLKIINRWGQEVFTTTDISAGWDGGHAPPGVYYWLLAYEGKNGKTGTAKGWVQLMR
ncbi:MAG: gliding motility-associated C-terminal domain-containing protein [Cyclobacteriaceae bacterium]|nr:gliding motility-associated C-terminal domain-containing protein [Cyclobacteriaceae bacterium]